MQFSFVLEHVVPRLCSVVVSSIEMFTGLLCTWFAARWSLCFVLCVRRDDAASRFLKLPFGLIVGIFETKLVLMQCQQKSLFCTGVTIDFGDKGMCR